ncbi:hypothetical protein L195_g018233 [Trifolium pratense]|uniref:Reverse transcriptase zinc-binding domain-containing protein n=1 Tax=Trifolium pratense TaxID=57577 RepID=A0A2K3MW67_TRIPR|nr:hypothetical protein L195_g018233 [Trifolium pratense]
MSALAWRFVQNRLPTQENLQDGGVGLNSSTLCVGGHGKLESAKIVVWKEALKWLVVSVALTEGGVEHLCLFKVAWIEISGHREQTPTYPLVL